MDEIGHEEHEERHGCTEETDAGATADILVVHIINNIERAQNACQEHDGQAEHQHPGVEYGVETMGGIRPSRDDGCEGCGINHVVLHNDEIAALEEGGHSAAQEQRTEQAVDDQAHLESLGTQEVTEFVLELITDSLQDEGEENDHPQPVGSAKRGAIEQGEGCEERSTEGDQCGKGELPLAARGVDDQPTALVGISQRAYHRVGALHEQQKY